MEVLNLLLQQDVEILIPCMIALIVVLNWTMKIVMMAVKFGVTLSIIAAAVIYLPHLQ